MGAGAIIPSLLPIFMVIAMRRAEARIYRQLADAGAFNADAAIELSLGGSFERRRLQGLESAGAVRLAAPSRHYIDADGWARFQLDRRRRVMIAVSIVAALLGIGLAVMFAMR